MPSLGMQGSGSGVRREAWVRGKFASLHLTAGIEDVGIDEFAQRGAWKERDENLEKGKKESWREPLTCRSAR